MLEILLGRAVRSVFGFEGEKSREAEVQRLRRQVRMDVAGLIEQVDGAESAAVARRVLAGHWRGLRDEQRTLDRSCGSLGIEIEGPMAMRLLAHAEVIAAPDFDDLPIRAAGMTRVDEIDGAPVWIGTGAQMLEAVEGARRRGLRLAVDMENRASRLHRATRLVATLVEDQAHVTPLDARPIEPPRSQGSNRGLAFLAVIAALFGAIFLFDVVAIRAALAAAIVTTAGLWLWTPVGKRRRRQQPTAREHGDELAIQQLVRTLRDGLDVGIASIREP